MNSPKPALQPFELWPLEDMSVEASLPIRVGAIRVDDGRSFDLAGFVTEFYAVAGFNSVLGANDEQKNLALCAAAFIEIAKKVVPGAGEGLHRLCFPDDVEGSHAVVASGKTILVGERAVLDQFSCLRIDGVEYRCSALPPQQRVIVRKPGNDAEFVYLFAEDGGVAGTLLGVAHRFSPRATGAGACA